MIPYQIERTVNRKNFQNLLIRTEEKTLSIHSLDPIKESERILKKLNPNSHWVLIAGAGLGYLPDYLLNKTHFQIIVFDHLPELSSELQTKWKKEPRIHFFSKIDDLLLFVEENSIEEMNLYFHRPYLQLFGDIYDELEGRLTAFLSKKKINQATLYRFQKTWLTNLIKNSRFFEKTRGVRELEQLFPNVPAVLVGAGPSLQSAFPALKKFRKYYLLIAVDTALLPLQEADLQPDFVVSMDPQDKNAQYLLYAKSSDFCLILDGAGHSQIFERFQGQNLFMSDSIFPVYQALQILWGAKGHLKSGGSVSTSAFSLARLLGCKPLILVGQDMAFSQKQIHTSGTILEEMLYYQIDRFHTYEYYHTATTLFADSIQTEGWDQKTVFTDRKFLTFLKWFESEVSNTSVYQTSSGGIKIKGAKHQKTEEVLNSLPKTEVDFSRFSEIKKTTKKPPHSKMKEVYSKILEDIKDLLPLIHSQVIEVQKLQTAFIKKENSKIQNSLRRLNQNDLKLLKKLKQDNLSTKFVDLTMQETIQEIIRSANASALSLDLIKTWEKLYAQFKNGLLYSRYLLSKSLSLISSTPAKPS